MTPSSVCSSRSSSCDLLGSRSCDGRREPLPSTATRSSGSRSMADRCGGARRGRLARFVPDPGRPRQPSERPSASLSCSLLPVVIAIAILRYRLYEIDRIISRTVAYAVVTGAPRIAFVGDRSCSSRTSSHTFTQGPDDRRRRVDAGGVRTLPAGPTPRPARGRPTLRSRPLRRRADGGRVRRASSRRPRHRQRRRRPGPRPRVQPSRRPSLGIWLREPVTVPGHGPRRVGAT